MALYAPLRRSTRLASKKAGPNSPLRPSDRLAAKEDGRSGPVRRSDRLAAKDQKPNYPRCSAASKGEKSDAVSRAARLKRRRAVARGKKAAESRRAAFLSRRRAIEERHAHVPALFPKLSALPPELRQLVFYFAIDTDTPRCTRMRTPTIEGFAEPALAMVSKRVRAEALHILYNHCVFRIDTWLGGPFDRWLGGTGPPSRWPGFRYASSYWQRARRRAGGDPSPAAYYDVTIRPRIRKVDLCFKQTYSGFTMHLRRVAGAGLEVTWTPPDSHQWSHQGSPERARARAEGIAKRKAKEAAWAGFDLMDTREIAISLEPRKEDYE